MRRVVRSAKMILYTPQTDIINLRIGFISLKEPSFVGKQKMALSWRKRWDSLGELPFADTPTSAKKLHRSLFFRSLRALP